MLRAGLYARVSTNDQQTLAMQNRAMREYAARRGWTIALQVREVNSGAARREAREKLIDAARRREIDVVLVWRLDRWGRSVTGFPGTDPCGAGFWPDLFPREIGCAAFPKAHNSMTHASSVAGCAATNSTKADAAAFWRSGGETSPRRFFNPM